MMTPLVWSILTLAAAAQQPFPNAGDPPAGIVLDEQGQPVSGALVTMRNETPADDPYALAIEQVVRKNPFPRVLTNRTGEFVLQLLPDQQRLGTGGEGRFALIVEKEGYQRWREPLAQGIAGYLGSRVTLVALRAEDRITIVVEDPAPGMLLVLRRAGLDDGDPGESILVPKDGRVSAALPIQPSPGVRFAFPSGFTGIRLEARVFLPGRSTPPQALDPDRENKIPKPAAVPAQARRFRRDDGAELSDLRGRYRCADGFERWFALEGSSAPEDKELRLVAVAAAGCEPTRDVDSGVLARSGQARPAQPVGTLKLLVTSERQPVAGASILLPNECIAPDAPGALLPRTNELGEVMLASLPAGEHRLWIVADSCVAAGVQARVLEQKVATVETSLDRSETYEVCTNVGGAAGSAPVPFACLGDPMSGLFAAWSGMQPKGAHGIHHTDSLGRLVVSFPTDKTPPPSLYTLRGKTLERGAITHIAAGPITPCLVRVPLGTRVVASEWRANASISAVAGLTTPTREGACAFYFDGFAYASAEWILGIKDAPTLTIREGEVTQAPRRGGLAVLDRRELARRVGVRLAEPTDSLLAVPWGNLALSPTLGSEFGNLAVRRGDGAYELALRDLGACRIMFLHPEFLPVEQALAARGAEADGPLEIAWKRGARITLRVGPGLLAADAPRCWVSLMTRADSKIVWTWDSTARGDLRREGAFWLLPAPRAFPPGEYKVVVRYSKLPMTEQLTTLALDKPVVVAIEKPGS